MSKQRWNHATQSMTGGSPWYVTLACVVVVVLLAMCGPEILRWLTS